MAKEDLAEIFDGPDYSRFLIDYFQGGIAAFAFNYTKSYDIATCDHLEQFEASSQGQLAALDVLYGLKMEASGYVQQLYSASKSFDMPDQRDICTVDVYRRKLETYRSIGGDSMHLETCLKAVEKAWQFHGFGRDRLSSTLALLERDCVIPALMDFSSRGSNAFRYYLGIAVDDWTMKYRPMGYDMTEMFFSLDRYELNDVLQAAQEIALERKGEFAMVFPSPELYMAPGSNAWMSPCHGSKSCIRMGVFFQSRHYPEMKEHFDSMHQAFVERGLHPVFHWGKYVSRDQSTLRNMRAQLPRLEDFLEVRKQQDPYEIFLTDDWKLYLGIDE
uniref:D-arabinono-1,4-lactone oxidase C-terminal domain-containing protein n=1 Tax=Grammatophora oceanica TaxID=210454 RepID=A0A7S1UNM0_9STRA